MDNQITTKPEAVQILLQPSGMFERESMKKDIEIAQEEGPAPINPSPENIHIDRNEVLTGLF